MNRFVLCLCLAAASLQAQNPLSTEVKAAYEPVKGNILKAAERMPDADFGFKPTPDIRSFGQLIAHVADAQMGLCSIAQGAPHRGDAASKTSKADLIAALKASNDACDAAYSSATDEGGTAMLKTPLGERTKLGLLNFNVTHDNEMYGTISVYLRLKGLVPPSSDKK